MEKITIKMIDAEHCLRQISEEIYEPKPDLQKMKNLKKEMLKHLKEVFILTKGE